MMATAQSPIRISDRYEVGEALGQGLGSSVFRGEDTVLKRQVAIKLVPPENVATYRAALGATARIGHPAYIGVFDALEYDGQLAIIQELIIGQSFAELAHAQPSTASVAKIGRQLTMALAHAHRQGIAHGDITPTALFRDQWGAMRLNNVQLPPNADYFAAASRLLKPGDDPWVVGEPKPRDDLRAVAVALWLLLAGRDSPPIEATGLQEDWQIVGRDVPADLRDIIERLIDPEHPHALNSAEEAVIAFGVFIQIEEDRKPRRTAPPWSSALPRQDIAQTNPTQTTTTPPASTPPMLVAPTKPLPTTAYPQTVGNATPRNGDNEVTWVGGAQPTHLVPPVRRGTVPHPPLTRPVPEPSPRSGRFDYALWAALAIALFLFWLIIGYLVPGLLGK